MKTTFAQLQDQIGARGVWLADMLGLTPEHVSRLRNGHAQMSRSVELAMRALATGWRP